MEYLRLFQAWKPWIRCTTPAKINRAVKIELAARLGLYSKTLYLILQVARVQFESAPKPTRPLGEVKLFGMVRCFLFGSRNGSRQRNEIMDVEKPRFAGYVDRMWMGKVVDI